MLALEPISMLDFSFFSICEDTAEFAHFCSIIGLLLVYLLPRYTNYSLSKLDYDHRYEADSVDVLLALCPDIWASCQRRDLSFVERDSTPAPIG